jgi:hypothetical protein
MQKPPDPPEGGWKMVSRHYSKPQNKGKQVATTSTGIGKKSTKDNFGPTAQAGSSSQQKDSNKPSLKEVLQQEIKYTQIQHLEEVLSLESSDLEITRSAWALKERFLGHCNYMTQDGKTRHVYEAILVETGSVQMEHFRVVPTDNRSAITHSKCYITRVLHIAEWGLDPSKVKLLKLDNFTKYNYWDYIQAWHYAFYYQSSIKKHSWLFIINADICKDAGFPNWFLVWWEKMGPELSIVPKEILDLFHTWYTYHPKLKGKTVENPPIGRNTLWFFAEFRLTWVWKWDLQIHVDQLKIPIIQRTFWCRWWDKFDIKPTAEKIKKTAMEFVRVAEEEKKLSTNKLMQSSNLFSLLLDSIKDQYPHLPKGDQKVKVMELIKEQFMASQLNEPKEEDVLAGEAQDPYEDYEDEDVMSIVSKSSSVEASMADFLDAMIATTSRATTSKRGEKEDKK